MPGRNAKAEFDCGAIERLDTVGAWLLLRTKRSLERRGIAVQPVHVDPKYRALVHTIDHDCRAPPVAPPPRHTVAAAAGTHRPRLQPRAVSGLRTGRLLRPDRVRDRRDDRAAAPPARRRAGAPDGRDRSERHADRRPAVAADRRGIRVSGLRPVAPFRRGCLHRQSAGRRRSARAGRIDGGDHRRRPIRLGLRRADRHDEAQRGNRRHPGHRLQRRRSADPAAPARYRADAAAADILFEHHGPDRRGGYLLSRSRHHHSRVPASVARRGGRAGRSGSA